MRCINISKRCPSDKFTNIVISSPPTSITWYADSDNDGFGNPEVSISDCNHPVGYVSNDLDINDNDAQYNPGTNWIKDQDNDLFYQGDIVIGSIGPEGYRVKTNELPGDCNDSDFTIHPNAQETYNNKDDDCDGIIDEGFECAEPTGLSASNITENSAILKWNYTAGAYMFQINYKPVNSKKWLTKNSVINNYTITDLESYTAYEYKIKALCLYDSTTNFSKISSFTTLYEGPPYCPTQGITGDFGFYIDRFKLGKIDNTSGDNEGYKNFTQMSTNLLPGFDSKIRITPGFTGTSQVVYCEVYIDYNQDGFFKVSDGEKVVAYPHVVGTSESVRTFTVPANATTGSTRMRVKIYNDNRTVLAIRIFMVRLRIIL